MHRLKSLLQKLFLDKEGHVAAVQTPNIPIIVWVVCMVTNKVVTNHNLSAVLSVVGTSALLVWAALELGWGVSNFRRLLGLTVMSWTLVNIIW